MKDRANNNGLLYKNKTPTELKLNINFKKNNNNNKIIFINTQYS